MKLMLDLLNRRFLIARKTIIALMTMYDADLVVRDKLYINTIPKRARPEAMKANYLFKPAHLFPFH